MRFGTVAIVGQANVGKTTLLNAALGEDLAITSAVAQTTRDSLLGVVHRPQAQIAFLDTPGLHRPMSELGRHMNATAVESARRADAVIMMVDARSPAGRQRFRSSEARSVSLADAPMAQVPPAISEQDQQIVDLLCEGRKRPRILVLNKVDLVGDKGQLLPRLDAFSRTGAFDEFIPASARNPEDVERILSALEPLLPEGPPGYDDETLTDRPQSFFMREYVREQILKSVGREVPHAAAVTLDQIVDKDSTLVIRATIHVDKVGHRKIIVGRAGQKIREIGTRARLRIEQLTGTNVFLELFVRVTAQWKNTQRQLATMGYDAGTAAGVLPAAFDRTGASQGGRQRK